MNQFGFTLSGPVVIPKMIDGRNGSSSWQLRGLPAAEPESDALQRPVGRDAAGDFSERSAPIRDPLTNAPFLDNVIPQARLSPVSLKLLEYYPLPNQPGSSLANNYLAVNDDWTDKDQFNTRIDFTESTDRVWYGRYGWTKEGVYTGGIKLNGSTVDTKAQQALVDNTRVLNSTLVNEMLWLQPVL